MKKKIRDLKPGVPFKHEGQVFIKDSMAVAVCLTDGGFFDECDENVFRDGDETLVTVCRRIKKSDIKERK